MYFLIFLLLSVGIGLTLFIALVSIIQSQYPFINLTSSLVLFVSEEEDTYYSFQYMFLNDCPFFTVMMSYLSELVNMLSNPSLLILYP